MNEPIKTLIKIIVIVCAVSAMYVIIPMLIFYSLFLLPLIPIFIFILILLGGMEAAKQDGKIMHDE